MKDRQDAIDRFQKDGNCKIFIGQILAAGVGITLTAANAVVFIELGAWSPSDYEQAEDRIYRIGQKADSVTAYYLIAPGTIEEDMAILLTEKYKTIKKVLDNKDNQDIFDTKNQDNLLNDILKKFMGKGL